MKKKLIKFVSLLFICCITAFGGVACKEDEPVHEHEYETVATAPTCTEKGFTTYTCACGDTYADNYVSELGHEFTNYVYNDDATCLADGTEIATCNRDDCKETDTRTKANSALGHKFTNYVFNNDAKCGVNGTETARCEHVDCEETDTKTKANSALDHKFTNYVFNNDAKCGVNGTETADCDNEDCNQKDTRTKIGTALSHSFTNYVSDNNATYEKDGTKTAKCNHGCGKTDTVTDIGSMLVKNTLTFKTLTVNNTNVYGKVGNTTDTFSFVNEIVTSGKTKYIVSTDISGSQQVASKTIPLSVGDNVVYITETVDGEPINLYKVTIRRKPIYTVSFNTDGGTAVENQRIEEDAFATEPQTTRLGYTFTGWNYDFATPITEDKTITASWTANTNTAYKVEYYLQNLDGGYTLQETVNLTGTTDTTAAAQIKPFEHFTYNESTGTPSGNINSEGTLVLQIFYTRNVYTVTWVNYDGGVLMTEEVVYGEEPYSHVFLSPTRNNDGEIYDYSFLGWLPEISAIVEDTVYTAQYEQTLSPAYCVNYNANGGTDEPLSQTKYKGESLTLRIEKPTREGYIFVGWNNLHEETVYQAGDKFTSDFHVTLFAMWEKTCEKCGGDGGHWYEANCSTCGGNGRVCKTCGSKVSESFKFEAPITIYYSCKNSNCGEVLLAAKTCSSCFGEGLVSRWFSCERYIKQAAPTTDSIEDRKVVLTYLEGYEYSLDGVHWQESNVFENLQYSTQYTFYQRVAKTKTMPFGTTSSGLTLTTAEATEFYVTYELNGGVNNSDNPSMYSVFDGNIPLNAPTKEYYDFTGWSYKGSIVTAIAASWAEDIELTATWKPTPYAITYELNGGNTTNPNEYHIESEFTLSTPIKEGHTFLGWTGSNGDTPELSVTIPLGTFGDLNYTAHWSINQYTISFVLNNGKSMDSITQDYGSELSIQDPVWEKHTFIGWFDVTLTNEYKLVTMPAENITLYAKWRANEYIVTYNANGGETSKDSDMAMYGEYYTLAHAERIGYTFKGWYNGDVRFNDGVWEYATYDQVVALTADWEIITYTITYELDGGTATNKTSYTVEDTTVLNQPKKTGYTFTGWTGTDLTEPNPTLTILKGSIGNRDYTANWQANEYTVTYHANGGVASKENDTAIYDENFTLATAERTGYTFDGWYNGTVQYTDGTWNTAVPVALKAKWTANEYTITYNPNGGTMPNTTQSITYDIAYTLYTPTRTGYTFLGWANGNEEFTSGTWQLTKDVSLVAQWQANEYTLSFNANGGEGDVQSVIVTYEQPYSVPAIERVGYAFEGWYSGSTEYFGGVWLTTSNVTLTAKWTAYTNIPYVVNHYLQNVEDDSYTLTYSEDFTGTADSYVTPAVKALEGFTLPSAQNIKIEPDGSQVLEYYYARNFYTISFISNGGSFVDSVTLKYLTPISLSDSVREMYTFGGWFTDVDLNTQFTETNVLAYSVTLYAWWSEENKPSDFTYSGSTEIAISRYVGTNTTVRIPEHIGDIPVTSISSKAFYGCSSLTNVIIPDSVTSIGSAAFWGCSGLTSLTVPFVGNNVNATTASEETLFGYIFGNAWSYSSFNGGIRIEQNYRYLESSDYYSTAPFYLPSNLKKITVTGGQLLYGAFSGCSTLTEIIICDTVTYIGQHAFNGCSSLESLTLPFVGDGRGINNHQALFGYVFGSKEYEGGKLFSHYASFPGESGTWLSCIPYSLKSVTITGGSICNYAFYGCSMIERIALPESITTIGAYTFYRCYGLTEISIPQTVKSIGAYAFYECEYLVSVTLPNSLISIGDYAFYYCHSLTGIVLPSGLQSIGNYAFWRCWTLTNINISKTVITIGESAFYRCAKLESITFEGTLEQWNSIRKGTDWNYNVPATEVICLDEKVTL